MKTGRKSRHTAGSRVQRSTLKAKRTFSLSQEAVSYLDALAKKYRSTSEALNVLILEKQEEAERQRISTGIRRYYDSMSDEEQAENKAWGEFVHSHLSKE